MFWIFLQVLCFSIPRPGAKDEISDTEAACCCWEQRAEVFLSAFGRSNLVICVFKMMARGALSQIHRSCISHTRVQEYKMFGRATNHHKSLHSHLGYCSAFTHYLLLVRAQRNMWIIRSWTVAPVFRVVHYSSSGFVTLAVCPSISTDLIMNGDSAYPTFDRMKHPHWNFENRRRTQALPLWLVRDGLRQLRWVCCTIPTVPSAFGKIRRVGNSQQGWIVYNLYDLNWYHGRISHCSLGCIYYMFGWWNRIEAQAPTNLTFRVWYFATFSGITHLFKEPNPGRDSTPR